MTYVLNPQRLDETDTLATLPRLLVPFLTASGASVIVDAARTGTTHVAVPPVMGVSLRVFG